MTVKTKGATGLSASVDSRAVVASASLAPRTRGARVERVVRDGLANIETSKSEGIDTSVTAMVIRSVKALGEAFFFILFVGLRFWGSERARIACSSTEKQAQSFREKCDRGLLADARS